MMFGGSIISCASTLALAATTFHGSSAAHDEHHSDDSVSTSFRAFVDHRENEGENTGYTRYTVVVSEHVAAFFKIASHGGQRE